MNKKIFMPFMAAALAMGFASCANDDLVMENTPENPVIGKNVAVFTNDDAPSSRANGPHKTTMNNLGQFFWTKGDYIWFIRHFE